MEKEMDIKFLEEDETKLYCYLVNLAKSEQGRSNISLFEKYLTHETADIRAAAIFSLLFVMKIDNPRYRQEAIKYVMDKSEDFDLRQWCVSGLAQTYFGKNDLELLSLFYDLLNDKNEDEDIKPVILRGILKLHGLSTQDVFIRIGRADKIDEEILSKFSVELAKIREIIFDT